MKKYYVEDIIKVGYTLEPLYCKFCGRPTVIFDQYIGDGYCENCGRWQLEDDKSRKQNNREELNEK